MDEVPDAIVIANATEPMLDYTFFYVTRLEVGRFEGSVAVLYPDGEIHVVTSLLEAESASHGDFNLHVFRTGDELNEMTADLLKNAKKIGINGNELTFKMYNFIKKNTIDGAEYIDVSRAVTRTRMVKDDSEIQTLKKACQIGSEVAELMIDFVKPGMKEFEVAAEMSYEMQKRGAVGPSFETILAFGKNSAEPHYSAGEAVLERGQFVLMDFGALYKRYCSDITRTYVCGPISDKHRKIYETVAEAQRLALETIRPGVSCAEPHNVAAEFINSTEFKGLFTHGLGHGLGLAVHDGGGLSPRAGDIIMEEGMVFTVEPGIYLPGFGGVRIEDDMVIRKNGPELLTTARRDLIEL